MDKRQILFYGCRILLGLLFLVSAILKFLSLESFELYVYGFGFFDLTVSSFVAHTLIGVEFLLGGLLIANVYNRLVNWATGVLLVVFSLFLIYLLFMGIDGNCHCFGTAVEFLPLESLLKNVFLFLLLLVASRKKPFNVSWKLGILICWLAASIAFSFMLKAPYSYKQKKEVKYNTEKFEKLIERDDVSQLDLMKGKKVIVFFSTKCGHCKVAVKKLEVFLTKNDFPEKDIQWFVMGNEENMNQFLSYTDLTIRSCIYLEPSVLLNITYGKVPVILLVDEGEVVGKMSNSTFNEEMLNDFVNK